MHVSYVYLQKTKALIMHAEIFNWTIVSDFVSLLGSLKKLVLCLVCCQKKKILCCQTRHTASLSVVFLLELSGIYLRSAYLEDKIRTCQVHLFLWENKNHPSPLFFCC